MSTVELVKAIEIDLRDRADLTPEMQLQAIVTAEQVRSNDIAEFAVLEHRRSNDLAQEMLSEQRRANDLAEQRLRFDGRAVTAKVASPIVAAVITAGGLATVASLLIGSPDGADAHHVAALGAGSSMDAGDSLASPDGTHAFLVNEDGHVAQMGPNGIVWDLAATRDGIDGVRVVMQHDCNLVVYADDDPIWATGTNGYGRECALVMQDDGNLVVIARGNDPVWSTRTGEAT